MSTPTLSYLRPYFEHGEKKQQEHSYRSLTFSRRSTIKCTTKPVGKIVDKLTIVFEAVTAFKANRRYSYSRYWTGTNMQLRLIRGVFSNANNIYLFLMIFPRMSLHCKLDPVQHREYEYGLFLFSF